MHSNHLPPQTSTSSSPCSIEQGELLSLAGVMGELISRFASGLDRKSQER